jgi:hypothetical protein
VLVYVEQMDKKLGELDTKLASVDVEQRVVVEPVRGVLCAGEDDLGSKFGLPSTYMRLLRKRSKSFSLPCNRRTRSEVERQAVLPVPPG